MDGSAFSFATQLADSAPKEHHYLSYNFYDRQKSGEKDAKRAVCSNGGMRHCVEFEMEMVTFHFFGN
jgi:hypothetical protein